jgi:hypothetical protein
MLLKNCRVRRIDCVQAPHMYFLSILYPLDPLTARSKSLVVVIHKLSTLSLALYSHKALNILSKLSDSLGAWSCCLNSSSCCEMT